MDPDNDRQTTLMINKPLTEWPEWKITKRILADQWPIEAEYYIVPSRINYIDNNLEHLTFRYLIPKSATISFRHLNRATIRFDKGGNYPVVIQIADDRGHHQELHDEIVLDDLPPLVGALDIFSTDPWYRVPLDVTVTPVVKQRVAGEFATSYRYFLDGKLVHEGIENSYLLRNVTTPGRHKVRVEVRTSHGRYISIEDHFSATTSTPPDVP
jgi:hypothetical protein